MPFLGTTGGGSVKQYGGQANLGYFIKNSLRFRASASGNLSRTFGTPTNGIKYTWSGWVKRGALSTEQGVFCQYTSNTDSIELKFLSTDELKVYVAIPGAIDYSRQTTAKFRDPSAWYHIVFVFDSANATSDDRIIFYINGTRVTAFTDPDGTIPQNNVSAINTSGRVHYLGYRGTSTNYLDGYLGEINFIDGQALTPSSFGKTDAATNQWIPKKFAGTYGTNGFYLKFADASAATAAAIGKDSSGNGNNWTPNNISVTAGVTYDSMTDSPTVGPLSSNFATWNPLRKDNNASISLANGNLAASGTTFPSGAFLSTIAAQTSGLFYAEFTLVGAQWPTVAVADVTVPNICPSGSMSVSGVVAWDNSNYFINGATVASGLTMNSADVIGVAFDAATRKVWFAQNNTWVSSGNPAAGTNERGTVAGTGALAFACRAESTVVIHANFGQRPFAYTPPSGFKSLNTFNLP